MLPSATRTRRARAKNKNVSFFLLNVWVMLAGEFTKSSRALFLAAFDCFLEHPTPSHTPYKERDSILRAVVVREELQLSASYVQTCSWGLFFSYYVRLAHFDQFRPLQKVPESRRVDLP